MNYPNRARGNLSRLQTLEQALRALTRLQSKRLAAGPTRMNGNPCIGYLMGGHAKFPDAISNQHLLDNSTYGAMYSDSRFVYHWQTFNDLVDLNECFGGRGRHDYADVDRANTPAQQRARYKYMVGTVKKLIRECP